MYLVDPVTNFYLCRGTESFVLFIPLGTAWVGHIGDNNRIVQGTSKELAGEAWRHAFSTVDHESRESSFAIWGQNLYPAYFFGTKEYEAFAWVNNVDFVGLDGPLDQWCGALHYAELRGDRPEEDRGLFDFTAANNAECTEVNVGVLAMRVYLLDGQLPAFLPLLGYLHYLDFELTFLFWDRENLCLATEVLLLDYCG